MPDFPPGVREALDDLIQDSSDPLHPLALKLGRRDGTTAKRWRDVYVATREREAAAGEVDARMDVVLPFLDSVRLALMRAATCTQIACRQIEQGLRQALEHLPEIEHAGLAPMVRHDAQHKMLALDTIKRAAEIQCRPIEGRTIERDTFHASCQPSQGGDGHTLNEIPWGPLLEKMLLALKFALPPEVSAKHGASETQVRFIRALGNAMYDRFGLPCISLVEWVCSALGYRTPAGLEYTPDRLREILQAG